MKFFPRADEPMHIALTSGHTALIPVEGCVLDKMFHKEAVARGAILESQREQDEAQAAPNFDRKEVIRNAILAMLDDGEEEDFTADGRPDLRKLNARLGFKASRDEVDPIWAEVESVKA